MLDIRSSDLKTILHSKRANLYYLEHCRVLVNGGRVEYVTDHANQSLYWNIPIANSTSILLGTGTSITQAAVRELAKAGVMIGFCGGGGTPLFASNEAEFACQFFSPQSEYRATEYLQKWCGFWFDDERRLKAAKLLQKRRLELILELWAKHDWDFASIADELANVIKDFQQQFDQVENSQALLAAEGRLSKKLYSFATRITQGNVIFTREQGLKGKSKYQPNQLLDHGNYLAYGLGATCCWVLGLPHGLSILHGKTRRGGLVFDVADIIKDSVILPQAFISAVQADEEKEFRQSCLNHFADFGVLDIMIETVERIAEQA
ncbi:type I-F CRISPR-associated endonuclease Cas1f [Orbaceae bacterium ac157xtp]